jgi:hypothetical protein
MPRRVWTILGPVSVLAFLLIAGAPASFAAGGASNASPAAGGLLTHSNAPAPRTLGGSAPSAVSCQDNLAHFDAMGLLTAPPTVAPSQQAPCGVGVDESALSFLSNASGSAGRFQMDLTLPPAGTAEANVLASWSVSFWASGVPCSIDQATEVQVQLIPPMGPYLGPPSLNWSVRAPAYDLVPAGACDPMCTNASALVTLEGASYCEDQVVLPRAGGPPVTPIGAFAPNDNLILTVVGGVGSVDPLTVYLNDSTHPSTALQFSYAGADTLTGLPLTPRYDASRAADPVWGLSPGISTVVRNCPSSNLPAAPCYSYNGSASGATTAVQLRTVQSWNSTLATYANVYPSFVAASSTRSCQSSVIPCTSFGLAGGGNYPTWGMYGYSVTGAPWFAYGGLAADLVRTLTPQYDPSGIPTAAPLTALSGLSIRSSGPSLSVQVRATDPSGVIAVNASSEACSSTSTAGLVYASMSLSGGVGNSSVDGTWTTSIPLGYTGTYPVWLSAESAAGLWSPLLFGEGTWGPPSTCTVVAPSVPVVQTSDVLAISGGLLIHWNESDPIATGFVVNLTSALSPNASFTVGPVRELRAELGAYGADYDVTVAALNANGLASAPSPGVTASTTLQPLTAAYSESPTDGLWVGSATLTLNVTPAGTVGPYSVIILWGDSGVDANFSVSGTASFTHDYGLFYGDALAFLIVGDGVGDQLVVGPLPIWIGATPLGIAQTASAGDGLLNATFNRPVTPVAPATRFSLTWTSDPSKVWELGAGVLSNASVPGISVWNTTTPYQYLAAPDNVTVFLEVRAWNAYGLGQLPAGFVPVAATPRPLLLTPILALTGGLAPYTDNLTATATAGSNTTLTSVLFTFPGGTLAPLPVEVNGTFYLNATVVFPSPGSFTVVLHVVDAYYDIAIETFPVFVAPGIAPALSGAIVNPPSYAGTPIDFQATATGGSGNYAFNWSFGDGGQAAGPIPAHTYAGSGQYSVVLTCTDVTTGGHNTTVLPVTVYAIPVIFVSVTQGPNGSLSYEFRASVGGGSGNSTVVWTFGDGTVARGSTVTHDYVHEGTFTVNVSATDPAGRAGSTQFNLSAFPTPGPSGSSGAGGLSLLDTILLVAAAGFGTLTVLLILWRGRPPEGEPVDEEEDGAVSLT